MEIQPSLSKAVLALDDDVEACALLEHLLQPHRVIGVAHAYVALELLAREAFDLIILDVHLPEMDGLELCRWIRREDPHVPIVICSGAAGTAARHEALHAGASAYYGKPLEPESFRTGIEQLVLAAEDRNRNAEALVCEQLDASAREVALAAMEGRGASAASAVEHDTYWRFVEAGGTRAHFVRAWPTLLEKALMAGRTVQTRPTLVGRHGG